MGPGKRALPPGKNFQILSKNDAVLCKIFTIFLDAFSK